LKIQGGVSLRGKTFAKGAAFSLFLSSLLLLDSMHERVIILSIILEEKDGGVRFVVSHSSTIKLWMNGAQMFLVIS